MSMKLSVIIPAYSGLDRIEKCFDSILNQKSTPKGYEVVVVVDGSPAMELLVKKLQDKFIRKKVSFQSIFLKQNRGRFEARIIGAEAAKYDRLLFIDDRVELASDFFSHVSAPKLSKENAVMPNVIEAEATNVVSATISMIRKRIWGSKAGEDFDDYYINDKNFEKSPKGTTSLLINKKVFLAACRKVGESLNPSNTSRISDDTKVLRQIVEDGTEILRVSGLKVHYEPRNNFSQAWRHLFWRGPKFVDYYHRPGTRFFPLLAAVYLLVMVIVAFAVLSPVWLLYFLLVAVALALAMAAVIAKSMRQFFVALVGLPLTVIIFSAGILTGTLLKIAGR